MVSVARSASDESNLPNALVVGPMKSGTSWIQDYLQARGDVALPAGVKETFFFDRRYQKGHDWYATHFFDCDLARQLLIMEVAPSYFHSVDAPARIKRLLGNVPLVVTLRDPVRRSWSHYLHLRRYGYTTASLRRAILDFPEILDASRYVTCLTRWKKCFPEQHIQILWQEDLARSPEQYAQQLCEALSLPFTAPGAALHERSNAAAMPRSTRLAAIGDRTAHFLRERRLYGAVNLAKRLGFKELFFGRPGNAVLPSLDDSDAEWLTAQLEGEMPPEFFEDVAQKPAY